jgi:hypothetical protein
VIGKIVFAAHAQTGGRAGISLRSPRLAGYDGFVASFSYLGLARPLAWIMAVPPVAFLGRKFYKLAARTRSCESGIRHTPNHQAKS